VAGAGGVIFSPGGHIQTTFSWSLGITSNNQAKAYALYKGLSIAKSQDIEELIIIGDSGVILNQFRKRSLSDDMKINNIMSRILLEAEAFQTLQCFHVLRTNNTEADSFSNLATRDSLGILQIDGRGYSTFHPLMQIGMVRPTKVLSHRRDPPIKEMG
jgi:ribonuclease HI